MKIENFISYFKDINQIVSAKYWVRFIFFAFVFVLLIFAGSFIFVDSKIQKSNSNESTYKNLKQQYIYKTKIAKSLPEIKKQADILRNELQYMLDKISSAKQQASHLIEDISNLAKNNALDVGSVTPSLLKIEGHDSVINVKIIVNGTYKNITNFIFSLSVMKRIILINNYQIVSINNSLVKDPILKLTLDLKSMGLNKDKIFNKARSL